jgi:anti-sigma factor RsiW
VNAERVRELFSAAWEAQLEDAEQLAFDAALDQDPALAAEYTAFCATLDAVDRTSVKGPAPDLLRGVQKRLRNASGGRYYADRFAERSGVGRFAPWFWLAVLALLLGVVWLAFGLLGQLSVSNAL